VLHLWCIFRAVVYICTCNNIGLLERPVEIKRRTTSFLFLFLAPSLPFVCPIRTLISFRSTSKIYIMISPPVNTLFFPSSVTADNSIWPEPVHIITNYVSNLKTHVLWFCPSSDISLKKTQRVSETWSLSVFRPLLLCWVPYKELVSITGRLSDWG
jgi:hypothetical protein